MSSNMVCYRVVGAVGMAVELNRHFISVGMVCMYKPFPLSLTCNFLIVFWW